MEAGTDGSSVDAASVDILSLLDEAGAALYVLSSFPVKVELSVEELSFISGEV